MLVWRSRRPSRTMVVSTSPLPSHTTSSSVLGRVSGRTRWFRRRKWVHSASGGTESTVAERNMDCCWLPRSIDELRATAR